MPPRLSLTGASRSLVIRPRPCVARLMPIVSRIAAQRGYAKSKPTGPNQDNAPHVSEEAAGIAEVTGETPPDLSQGTPVQEILERDEKAKEKAPEVIKEEIDSGKTAADKTSFENLLALGRLDAVAEGGYVEDVLPPTGIKFGLPTLPIESAKNIHHRYDPLVDQVTNLIMKDGKKSVAQRNMSFILNHLRTAPAPTFNPQRPLLPGCPPPTQLPLNPVLYLTVAIDSVAPLLRIRSQKGAAGGGTALQIPVPLFLKQRRRTAVQWILDAASKKKSRGSGRGMFAQRVAEEIISVVEGKSSAWDKRGLIHKSGTSARANLNFGMRRRL